MQILKANTGKSVTVQHILNSASSICFIYDTGWTPSFECYMIDSKEASVEQLIECIKDQMHVIEVQDKHFDYLVVYINKEEYNITNLLIWLDENKNYFNVVDILVTCKSV
jgi:hypothetical protein